MLHTYNVLTTLYDCLINNFLYMVCVIWRAILLKYDSDMQAIKCASEPTLIKIFHLTNEMVN